MKVLISFCNRSCSAERGDSSLLLLDISSGERTWIPIAAEMRGITGVVCDRRRIYAALQSETPGIAIIDGSTLQVLSLTRLPEVRDVHSIAVYQETLWIASTGTDEILQYRLEGGSLEPVFERVTWSPPGASQSSDTHHLSSLFFDGATLWASAFGPRVGELWSSAQSGYVVNVSTGRLELENLYHPHSVFARDGHVYCCESSSRSVMEDGRRILTLESGYTRGLQLQGRLLLLGTSSGRTHSRSTGLMNNLADPGPLLEDCRLLLFERETHGSPFRLGTSFEFLPRHREIYDVVFLC